MRTLTSAILSMSLPCLSGLIKQFAFFLLVRFEPDLLGCLGGSVGRAAALKAGSCGFESHLSSLFFYENRKEGSQVCCLACLEVENSHAYLYVHIYMYIRTSLLHALITSSTHFYLTPSLWNNLPSQAVTCTTLSLFKYYTCHFFHNVHVLWVHCRISNLLLCIPLHSCINFHRNK